MRNVAWAVLLTAVVALAVLTAAMFFFVLAVGPGECEDPSCLAVQTYNPAQSVSLPPTVEPTESGVPAPPVAPGAASPGASAPATTAP